MVEYNEKDQISPRHHVEGRSGKKPIFSGPKARSVMLALATGLILLGLKWFDNPISTTSYNDAFSSIPGRQDPFYAFNKPYEPPANTPFKGPTLNPETDHLHIAPNAMVASDVPVCSTLGKKVLLKGGNAADAAVTVALCIGSINSHSSGIGGGSYILSKNGEDVISIDAREAAPEKAHKDMYKENPLLSVLGGLAVAVPGELKGLDTLFRQHGSGNVTWKELFEPVIKLNRGGFPVTKLFEKIIDLEDALILSRVPQIRANWDFIYGDDGELLREGQIIFRPNLARTLELIANNGSSDIFYDPEGPIVGHLVNSTRRFFGILTKSDFAAYKVHVEEPVKTSLEIKGKEYEFISTNGVSSGPALVAGLNFFNEVQNESDDDVTSTHKLIESFKWLAAVRTYFGDSRTPDEKKELVKKFSGKQWIKDVLDEGKYSDNHTFGWRNYGPQYESVQPKGTSHFSVVDKDGNAVSMTTTINLSFGSLVLDPVTGVILNNEMDDFSSPGRNNTFGLSPSIYNFIGPFRRPLSSTSPTIVIDKTTNKTDLVIGAAGGSRIPTAVLQAIYRVYYKGYTLLESMAYPRLHHQLIPEVVMVEDVNIFNEEHREKLGGDIASLLSAFGHQIEESGAQSAMNGIRRVAGSSSVEGVSDFWRKRGEADGC